ncbi:hypothetical protein NIES4102_10210 [Chondrocystis sp. NIES-4102]|nr:hypothetical protein NIES4102_10210 [Chondrocystis sp. NIES-4102]
MILFNTAEPIIRSKQEALDFQDRQGLLQLKLEISDKTLFKSIYTRIDQVFVIWGLITTVIFFTAQFAPIDWITQAIFWSILTAVGTGGMTILTYFWVKVERLQWVLYAWVVLMLSGIMITDLGFLLGSGEILTHLCHLWLGISAIGYVCTGLGLKSRAFIISGLFHAIAILILPFCLGWQFLATGLIMTANLLFLAQTQWDMRPPIEEYDLLNEEQRAFNREQYLIRQT